MSRGVHSDARPKLCFLIAAAVTIGENEVHHEVEPKQSTELQMARETPDVRFRSTSGGQPAAGVDPAQPGVFRKEGDFWTVGLGGKVFRMKNSKGLGYLAHLLRHPAVEFHVLDLAGGIAGRPEEDETSHVASLGDAGDLLDEQAKASYRRRFSDLREELKQAKELGSVERAEHAEQEIDALTRELSRAVGLGGRSRRAASASERARQSITKSIKSVQERIAQTDDRLGEIFARCIRTGVFCSYQPDPDRPVAWEFAAIDAGPTLQPAKQTSTIRKPAPTLGDNPQLPPNLHFLPFSLAERTAFVGRESEGSAISTNIDRAINGQGSIVMLWDGPGVGKSRLAIEMAEYASRRGFRCSIGRCYESDEPFPYLPFAEIIESDLAQAASLDDFRLQMGPYAAEMAQIAPSLRRIFRDPSRADGTSGWAAAPLSFPEFRRSYGPCGSKTPAAVRTRGSSLGRRIYACAFDVSGPPHRTAPGPDYRDLPQRIFERQSGVGPNA